MNTDHLKPSMIPIHRLSVYIKAVGILRKESISTAELMPILEDVTHRQVREDLQLLGFINQDTLPRDQLARRLRLELNKLKASRQIIQITPVTLPTPREFINLLKKRGGTEKRAQVIEAAYQYAVEEPENFLLGHGLFNGGLNSDQPALAYRHQVSEAQKIVEQFLGNVIAVHEVGLGKTITAMLVLAEFLLREPELSVLILVPTNLRLQWADEIKRFLDLDVYSEMSPDAIMSSRFVLLSIDTAKEKRWAALLNQRKWDFLVVDESHILRNEITTRYRFVYSVRAHHRLFLTATPVHNSPYDIYHQVNVVHPGLLGRKEVFSENHVIGDIQLAKPADLQEQLLHVVSHQARKDTGLSFPSRDVKEIRISNRSGLEHQLYDDVLRILRGIYRRHLGASTMIRRYSGFEQQVSQLVLISILVLRELSSHPLAALKTLNGALLKQVKHFATLTKDYTDQLELESILKNYKDQKWLIGAHAKTDALIEQLPGLVKKHGRVIVYVEFRETQKIIIERLMHKRKVGLPQKTDVISFHGGLGRLEKRNQIERYEHHEKACFISTDAGGQGLNLQKGNVIVNFDFPWNPMRVEQRIGRVDRLEQKASEVLIRNFITTDTIEQYVYRTLQRKLKVCEDVLGHVLPVIFNLNRRDRLYYSESDVLGIGQLILSSKDEEDLRRKFSAFGRTIEENLLLQQQNIQTPTRWIYE